MYAIIDIAGQQLKVEKGQEVLVNRLENKEGDKVDFFDVMMIDNDGKATVGSPMVDGAKVTVKVLEHLKGDKVTVFKKKRRKGYQKLNGHRQQLTLVQIEDITEKGAKRPEKAEAKKEEPKAKAAEKKESKATAAQKETTTGKAMKEEAAKPGKQETKADTPKEGTAENKSE